MVLRGAAWCCVVLRGVAWCCVVLRGVAWCCVVLRGAAVGWLGCIKLRLCVVLQLREKIPVCRLLHTLELRMVMKMVVEDGDGWLLLRRHVVSFYSPIYDRPNFGLNRSGRATHAHQSRRTEHQVVTPFYKLLLLAPIDTSTMDEFRCVYIVYIYSANIHSSITNNHSRS